MATQIQKLEQRVELLESTVAKLMTDFEATLAKAFDAVQENFEFEQVKKRDIELKLMHKLEDELR